MINPNVITLHAVLPEWERPACGSRRKRKAGRFRGPDWLFRPNWLHRPGWLLRPNWLLRPGWLLRPYPPPRPRRSGGIGGAHGPPPPSPVQGVDHAGRPGRDGWWRRTGIAATVSALIHGVAGGLVAAGAGTAALAAEVPRVVVSVKPLHALVSGVMSGVGSGEPALLIAGARSPHSAALRPSELRLLARADLVFWVGKTLEPYLVKSLSSIAGRTSVIAAEAVDGVTLLPARRGGVWSEESAGASGSTSDNAANRGNAGAMDPHIWLDPDNARAIVHAAAVALGAADPARRAAYAANARRMSARIDTLDAALRTRLAPIRAVPYAVFHDAYQYFERRYGLNAVGALAVSPERRPGARRVLEMRTRMRDTGARCLFTEPQFTPALVATVIEGSDARAGVLDPLGIGLAPGADAYFGLMEELAASLGDCLGSDRASGPITE